MRHHLLSLLVVAAVAPFQSRPAAGHAGAPPPGAHGSADRQPGRGPALHHGRQQGRHLLLGLAPAPKAGTGDDDGLVRWLLASNYPLRTRPRVNLPCLPVCGAGDSAGAAGRGADGCRGHGRATGLLPPTPQGKPASQLIHSWSTPDMEAAAESLTALCSAACLLWLPGVAA